MSRRSRLHVAIFRELKKLLFRGEWPNDVTIMLTCRMIIGTMKAWIVLVSLCQISCGNPDKTVSPTENITADAVNRFDASSDLDGYLKVGSGSWSISDGHLLISADTDHEFSSLKTQSIFEDDYVTWVDVEWIEGDDRAYYGLFVNSIQGHSYGFVINRLGSFFVGRWDGIDGLFGNAPATLVERTWHESHHGTVRLAVDVAGPRYEFYVGANRVAVVVDSTYSRGSVEVAVEGVQTVAFDDFSIAVRQHLR